MPLSTISHQGQVRVPGEVRRAAGLKLGRIVRLVIDHTSARVLLRPSGKLTVPMKLREAAHLIEGTFVEVEATRNGDISVRPIEWHPVVGQPRREEMSPDQAWFWTPEWLAGEEEASTQIRAGKVRSFMDDQAFLDSLRPKEL